VLLLALSCLITDEKSVKINSIFSSEDLAFSR
jgi:hypothetical protein